MGYILTNLKRPAGATLRLGGLRAASAARGPLINKRAARATLRLDGPRATQAAQTPVGLFFVATIYLLLIFPNFKYIPPGSSDIPD